MEEDTEPVNVGLTSALPPPATPTPTPQGQEELATTLQRLLAPMQAQLAHLVPMNEQLQ